MDDPSAFSGSSGEVVRGYLRPGTLVTVLPVLVLTFLLFLLAAMLARLLALPDWIGFTLMTVAAAPVIGTFAVPARAGNLHAGFLEGWVDHSGAILAFSLRYAALAAPLGLALGLLLKAVQARAASSILPLMLGMSMGGLSPAEEGAQSAGALLGGLLATILLSAVFVILLTLAPPLILLVATRADTVGEMFRADAWRWLLGERRGDLPAFFAAMIGGAVLLFLIYLPLMALLAAAIASSAPRLGIAIGVFAYLAPFFATPILLGRLAGAFAVGDELVPGAALSPSPGVPAHAPRPAAPPAAARSAAPFAGGIPPAITQPFAPAAPGSAPRPAPGPQRSPTASPGAVGTPLERTPPVNLLVQGAVEKAASDVPGAIGDLEALAAYHPNNPNIAAELARLHRASGRPEMALPAAGRAIRLALQSGSGPIACDLFQEFYAEANHLGLDPGSFQLLGKILASRGNYPAAVWCFRAAHSLGADEATVQKGIIQIAEAALRAGRNPEALQVYESFLQHFPSSPHSPWVQEQAEVLRRRA